MEKEKVVYNIGDLVQIKEKSMDKSGNIKEEIYYVVVSNKRKLMEKIGGVITLYDVWALHDPSIKFSGLDMEHNSSHREYTKVSHG